MRHKDTAADKGDTVDGKLVYSVHLQSISTLLGHSIISCNIGRKDWAAAQCRGIEEDVVSSHLRKQTISLARDLAVLFRDVAQLVVSPQNAVVPSAGAANVPKPATGTRNTSGAKSLWGAGHAGRPAETGVALRDVRSGREGVASDGGSVSGQDLLSDRWIPSQHALDNASQIASRIGSIKRDAQSWISDCAGFHDQLKIGLGLRSAVPVSVYSHSIVAGDDVLTSSPLDLHAEAVVSSVLDSCSFGLGPALTEKLVSFLKDKGSSCLEHLFWIVHCKFFVAESMHAQYELLFRLSCLYVPFLTDLDGPAARVSVSNIIPIPFASAVCRAFRSVFVREKLLFDELWETSVFIFVQELFSGKRMSVNDIYQLRRSVMKDEILVPELLFRTLCQSQSTVIFEDLAHQVLRMSLPTGLYGCAKEILRYPPSHLIGEHPDFGARPRDGDGRDSAAASLLADDAVPLLGPAAARHGERSAGVPGELKRTKSEEDLLYLGFVQYRPKRWAPPPVVRFGKFPEKDYLQKERVNYQDDDPVLSKKGKDPFRSSFGFDLSDTPQVCCVLVERLVVQADFGKLAPVVGIFLTERRVRERFLELSAENARPPTRVDVLEDLFVTSMKTLSESRPRTSQGHLSLAYECILLDLFGDRAPFVRPPPKSSFMSEHHDVAADLPAGTKQWIEKLKLTTSERRVSMHQRPRKAQEMFREYVCDFKPSMDLARRQDKTQLAKNFRSFDAVLADLTTPEKRRAALARLK